MAQDNKPLTLTEKNFHKEVLDSSRPVLVDFWAGWCRPCHAVAPAIEELAEDFNGTAKVGKVDVEDQQALAQSFHIRSIPTLLFFRNGEVVDRAFGAVSKAVLAGKLEAHRSDCAPVAGKSTLNRLEHTPQRSPNSSRSMGCHRERDRRIHTGRMRKLLCRRWL